MTWVWFITAIALGFLIGSVGSHMALQTAYIRRLERVANLAELMQETRGQQNQELAQLKLFVEQVGQAVAALRCKNRKDLN